MDIKKLNRQYQGMHAAFWTICCAGTGFLALFLQKRGVGTGQIGVIAALFGAISSLLQPYLGRICDQKEMLTWKKMILWMGCLYGFLAFCLLFFRGPFSSGVLTGGLILLGNGMLPFLNTAHVDYKRQGYEINFGLARGIGSLLYALMAFLLGLMAQKWTVDVMPLTACIFAGVLCMVVYKMPCYKNESAKQTNDTHSKEPFLRYHPAFLWMLLASFLMMTSLSLMNTFLLQIIQFLGGKSSQLGVAIAIQAVVEVPVLFTFSKWKDRFKTEHLMLLAGMGYVVRSLMYLAASSIFMVYITQLTQMVSFAIFVSASLYYTGDKIEADYQNTGQSYMTSTMAAGGVLGNLLGGWILSVKTVPSLIKANVWISCGAVILALISIRREKMLSK